jgi:chemotaxis protein methyltransferase CheR
VRRAAAQILAGLGTKRSLKAVLPLLSDPDAEVRADVKLFLSRSGSAEAKRELARLLENVSGATREAEKKLLDAYAAITETAGPARRFNREEILPLRDFISETLGLHYDDERLNVLYQRLTPLAAACGFPSLVAFHRHLIVDPNSGETIQKMASQLSNNETYFFREMEQLQAFLGSVLPEIVRKKQGEGRPKLRVLSAGCSSGEEAYTLAMLLEEAGVRSRGCDVEILGMDVDQGVLRTARNALYPARSFRKGESALVKKYFECSDSEYAVIGRIRDLVTFSHGNLMTCADLGRFDVVLCRNVLIYFSERSVERVASNFQRMLLPGGYLLLGHSESLCRVETDFDPVRLERAVVYRRR